MINANITAYSGIYIGNFTIAIAFGEAVTGFNADDNLSIVAVRGNGTNGVVFKLTGAGKNWMLSVMLPEGQKGAFSIDIVGQVTTAENGQQAVIADPVTINYDTVREVIATFQELTYRDTGEIVLDISFYDATNPTEKEPMLWFDRTDLTLTKMAGDDIHCFNYNLISNPAEDDAAEGADYQVVFTPAPNTAGVFRVDMTGEVIKTDGLMREIAPVTPKLIVYNNRTPVLVDMGTPEQIAPHIWDTEIAFNVPIVGFGIDKLIYGVQTETPALFRAGSLDVKPPPLPLVDSNDIHLDACIGDWIYEVDNHNSRVQAKYWTLRFKTLASETEVPEIILKDNAVMPADSR